MNAADIKRQSESAYNQWAKQWREHAKYHAKHEFHPFEDLANTGIGKALILAANGYSLEENFETLKENQDNVDIMCCDKSLGHLISRGVTPTYCLVCDANVDYEKYMKPYEDQLENTILVINICGNPKWTDNGNWKKMYFFANEDILESEKEFMELSGCKNIIPAATNVSNAMVVFSTQSSNKGRANYMGYDKIVLLGYDYSWRNDGNYYAFDKTADGKNNYMRHLYVADLSGNPCYTSSNLLFSAQWLEKYCRTFSLPVVQCGRHSLLNPGITGKLEDHITYRHQPEDGKIIRDHIRERHNLMMRAKKIEQSIKRMGKDHHFAFVGSL